MQERSGGAFIVATANEASSLPPEFMRSGRFDKIFFVDLPTAIERASVLSAALRSHARGNIKVNLPKVASVCDGFTGAEIAAIVPDALFAAFADGAREITTDDLLEAAKTVVPLSKTAAEKITRLREWAKGRATPATSVVLDSVERDSRDRSRVLDI